MKQILPMVKIGINGFNRMGKLVYKNLIDRGLNVSIINDENANIEALLHSLRYDSTFGRNKNPEVLKSIEKVKVLSEKRPSQWNVDIILDFSGTKVTNESLSKYNCKYILTDTPSEASNIVVYKVNEIPDSKIIYYPDDVTNCLAPILKVVENNFGIVHASYSVVHSVTKASTIVDCVSLKRTDRSLFNIIPIKSTAKYNLEKIFPNLEINGTEFIVPINDVSFVDLTIKTEENCSLDDIFDEVIKAAGGSLSGVICYTDHEIVSSDYIGSKLSCVLDCKTSMDLGNGIYKLVCVYDNEYAPSLRIVDVVEELIKGC